MRSKMGIKRKLWRVQTSKLTCIEKLTKRNKELNTH